MPTTVVKTIGPSGCDYTTVSAWWAALPNMVTGDTIQVGEVQAGVEIVENLNFGSKTTDATRYPILRGAVPRADGPLRYDPSLGPAIKGSFASIYTGYIRIENLQFYHDTFITSFVLKSAGHRLTNVLIEGNGVNRILDTRGTPTAGSYCKNVALIYNTTSTSFPYICIEQTVPAEFDNLLIVRPSNRTSGNTAIFCGNWVKLQNSAVFGFSTIVSGSIDSTSRYNASNATWPAGTNNINGLTATAQFTNSSAASGTHDFRPVESSGLDAAGVDLSGAGVTTDIIGTTRAATPTIGPYEIPGVTTFNDVLSDSIIPSESLAAAATFGPSASDSVTPSESLGAVATMESAVLEWTALGDSLVASLFIPCVFSDPALALDVSNTMLEANAEITQIAVASGTFTPILLAGVEFSDSVNPTDRFSTAVYISTEFSVLCAAPGYPAFSVDSNQTVFTEEPRRGMFIVTEVSANTGGELPGLTMTISEVPAAVIELAAIKSSRC